MYAERKPPGIPPCENCKVDPMEENADVFKIFFTVREQYLIGMSGPMGLNHLAIYEAMRLYKIKNRQECFERVVRLHSWWMGENRKKAGTP